ncbi:MAG: hypothetical protein C0603_03460 [Denitrovibrio sp.]|nr:MAG: hypothetical protein C0603_03460 [Denitrovibrio sp.]
MQHSNISARLKTLRNELKLSQTDFGKRIGKNYHSVMRWELGRVIPPSNVLTHISELFDVNIDWLKAGEGDIFKYTQSNAASEKEEITYKEAPQNPANTPFLTIKSIAERNMTSEEQISLPTNETYDFAIQAPEDSAAPIQKGDIVFFNKLSGDLTDCLYLVKDRYSDVLIRWYSPKHNIWYSKRPDYADIPNIQITTIGKLMKVIREINV